MKVEVSNGELLDKLSILELKLKNIKDDKKLINIKNEHGGLSPLCNNLFNNYGNELRSLYAKLSEINAELWKIEDDIRECERNKDFGDEFVRLARAVYFTNDKRSDVKKSINLLTESGFVEEKSYEDYK
ncbi:MAG: DUF6165 family protein [Bacteroidota bacterium]|jgi:hypothetical protein|nr:hypothetical protein [Flavobacteriaceae bacterium]MEC7831519.1 DUF6165 family protein [Bacteroidota bacterium]|tara:strand:+ start:124 stop:510 length:387 start_codon:yes stop_codon:yes gene_type:complete